MGRKLDEQIEKETRPRATGFKLYQEGRPHSERTSE